MKTFWYTGSNPDHEQEDILSIQKFNLILPSLLEHEFLHKQLFLPDSFHYLLQALMRTMPSTLP